MQFSLSHFRVDKLGCTRLNILNYAVDFFRMPLRQGIATSEDFCSYSCLVLLQVHTHVFYIVI